MMIRALAAFGMMAFAITATAATPKPVEEFRQQANYQVLTCQIIEKTALNELELGSIDASGAVGKIGKCVRDGKASVKKLFPAALSAASKKPAAAKLLKDYYASWISAIDGVMPGTSEQKGGYAQRQDALEAKSDSIWNRFEIEAGY